MCVGKLKIVLGACKRPGRNALRQTSHINMMTQLTTGQPTVDAIGRMNFLEGSYVPHTWLKHLTYSNKRGTYTHHLAVLLLADIVYWYRPTVIKDEHSGELLGWKKKFAGDQLQRSYDAIAAHLGATYKQAREAVLFLKDIGLITAELRNFTTKTGLFVANALYLEPVAEQISMLQYVEKFSKSTLNRMIGRNILLLSGEYAEFFSLSTQIWVNRRKFST